MPCAEYFNLMLPCSRAQDRNRVHQVDMQKLEPPKGKKADAGENGPLPVDVEKARIEHAQVRFERLQLCAVSTSLC